MADIAEAAENLLALMAGKYDKVPIEPWGMKEYDDYEKRYLLPLTEDERVQVFEQAYYQLNGESLKDRIETLFDLAWNVYCVPFYKRYFSILEQEQLKEKKQFFFNSMRYYINEYWSEKQRDNLTDHEKGLLKKYCKQYDLPLPY
mgnify:CR=1 FL=1